MQARLATTKGVDAQKIAAIKYYLPLFVLAGFSAIFLAGHPNISTLAFRAVLNAPFVVAACFLLGVAEVRVTDHFLEYRRLIGWNKVAYNQIAQCNKSWIPELSYMRLVDSEGNSSKIYFVSGTLVCNEPPRTELTKYIDGHRSRHATRESLPTRDLDPTQNKSRQFCLIMGLVGFLWSVVGAMFLPGFLSKPEVQPLPSPVAMLVTILWRATTWPWALITCAFLCFRILRLQYKKKAWASALVLGGILGYMAVQAMR
jgi:hypothetical protein